jgi:diaphanous 1
MFHKGILLSRLKLSPEKIIAAILTVDDHTLSVENLKAIRKLSPTREEAKMYLHFEGDIGLLSKSDQYFKQVCFCFTRVNIVLKSNFKLSLIPRLDERLFCMIYRRKFDMDVEETRPELATLRGAVDELRTSDSFKEVLAAVLSLGNTINNATHRGNAAGFKLEDLLKVRESHYYLV